jgi:hypothetical protein
MRRREDGRCPPVMAPLFAQSYLLGLVQPEDVAHAALYLASGESQQTRMPYSHMRSNQASANECAVPLHEATR